MPKRPPNRRPHVKEKKEFEEQVIEIARVTKVVKGGRKLRFRATVVVGNKKGKVGIGIGKSHEVTGAIQKAISRAKKYMIQVNLDGSTIPHDIDIKLKSSKIRLIPAAPGTGLIAGGTIRKVLELAGVKDILSKSYGTTNKVNNTKATFEALRRLRKTPRMQRRSPKENQPTPTPQKDSKNKSEAAKPEVKKHEPKKPEVKKPETQNSKSPKETK